MTVENTSVFEPGRKEPERSPSPEKRDLSPLIKEFEDAGLLANNGHFDALTPENFPTIPKDELAEFRFVSYSMRIMRLMNIAGTSGNAAVKESFQKEAARLAKTRDEELAKHHSKVTEAPSSTPPPVEARPKPPTVRNDPDKSTGMYL